MADDSAILINQDTDTKGIKQCDFVIETDDVLTAEAVDSRCQTPKSVSENLAEVPVVIYKRQKKRKTEQADGIPKPSQDCLTSSMSLSTLYKEIVAKAKVDHSSREIQDIYSAVEEMLNRLVSGEIEIEYKDVVIGKGPTLKFRGADLQPCGSMYEKTSLWKSTTRQGRENKFLEFDYVVFLHNEDNEMRIRSGRCQGCRKVVIGDRHGRVGETLTARHFNEAFLEALYSLIDSKCSCHVDPDQTFLKDDMYDSRPCPECTVAKDTGRLQIAKVPDFSLWNVKHSEGCSIVFFWTSYTGCLLAPNIETLQTTERIGRLVIRVDVLPALTLPDTRDGDKCEKELFIIGKKCPYCYDDERFMVSYCMHELRALKQVSDQHKQCFIIIKFLYGQFIYWTGLDKFTNSYHAKVAFLTHCQTCKDEKKDCTTCITEILQSLVQAYRSVSLRLPEFHPVESLRVGYDGLDDVRKAYQIPILCLLHVLSQLEPQYRPCHIVDLIKRTCRILLEQNRPGIIDMDGRPFENTVSTEDILAVLLSDKALCYRVVSFPSHYDDVELYRLRCPEPERILLRWRATCMANMILASDITHIRDETIKQVVENVQDYVKKTHEKEWSYKQLLFLTSSQSVTEMPNNDSETSSLTLSLEGSCNDTTDRSVPTDSKFTDDLQLNWSALNFKEQLIEEIRSTKEKERQAEQRSWKEEEEDSDELLTEDSEDLSEEDSENESEGVTLGSDGEFPESHVDNKTTAKERHKKDLTTTRKSITDIEATVQQKTTMPNVTTSGNMAALEVMDQDKPLTQRKRHGTRTEQVASEIPASKRQCKTELIPTPSTSSGITSNFEVRHSMIEDPNQADSDEDALFHDSISENKIMPICKDSSVAESCKGKGKGKGKKLQTPACSNTAETDEYLRKKHTKEHHE